MRLTRFVLQRCFIIRFQRDNPDGEQVMDMICIDDSLTRCYYRMVYRPLIHHTLLIGIYGRFCIAAPAQMLS